MKASVTTGESARKIWRDKAGVALIEFAIVLPVMLILSLAGAEITNYIITKMQVSQLALMLADNAARMGSGSPLAAKIITEADINELFVGANLQSDKLDINKNGRFIVSDLEEDLLNPGKFRIKWQRCYGAKTAHKSSYGTAPTGNLTGIGPTGRQVTAQPGSATMFVEVFYPYKPLISENLVPLSDFVEIASMAVRERRDLSGIVSVTGLIASTC